MAVNLALLNSTQSEYSGELIHTFERRNVLLRELYDAKQVTFKGGTYIERPFSKGIVGNTTKIRSGTEMLTRTSNNIIEKLRVQPARIVHTLYIPNIDLAQNTGKNAIVGLLAKYPANDLVILANDKNRYFLSATTTGRGIAKAKLYGFLTLNGEFASGEGEGVTNGLLDFAAPSAQSDTVENVAKSTSTGHYNQYGLITAWATNGKNKLRRTLRLCMEEGGHEDASSYVVIMDDVTYGNFEDSEETKVRIQMVGNGNDNKAIWSLGLYNAKVYSSTSLDPADYTGAGINGVTYMIDKDFMEYQSVEKTEFGEWKDAEDQDVVYNKLVEHGNWIMQKFPAHGVVAGGNS